MSAFVLIPVLWFVLGATVLSHQFAKHIGFQHPLDYAIIPVGGGMMGAFAIFFAWLHWHFGDI